MPGSGSGLFAQLGFGVESTYGTPVTPTRFFEIPDGGENIALDQDVIASHGIRAGRRVQSSVREVNNRKGAAGDLNFDVLTKDFGFFLKYMLGKVTTTQPDAGGSPTVYDHTGTIDDLKSAGSLTCQVGRPAVDGTVHPFTYHGGMAANWEVGCSVDELVKLKLGMDFEDEETATALATPSYTAGTELLSFVGGLITLAGSSFDVREASVSGDNKLKTDRRFIRQNPLKKQPIESDLRGLSGSLSAEFESLTAYNRFVNKTLASLELLFEGSTITGIHKHTLKITCPVVRFSGATPTVEGKDVLNQSLPFEILDDGTQEPISILYRTTGATP